MRLFPGVNPGAFLAGMVIVAPVLGLRPFLCLRERTENVPNPVITTFSLRLSESFIPFKNTFTASFAALFVKLPFLQQVQ